jgi:predicted PurR-regulated permease PerM
MQFVENVIETTFASFLRVQLVFGILAGVVTWIVMIVFHVEFALSTSVIAGVLTIVPLLGPVLGLIPTLLVCAFFSQNVLIPVVISLLVAQQIIFNVIGPRLLGNAFKLHPVIVLLSFLVGFKLAGTAGAIFAVPALGIIVIVLHRLSKHFLNPTKE